VVEFFAKNSNGAKHTQFDGGFSDAEGICDYAIRLFFDEAELDDDAQTRRERSKRGTNGDVRFFLLGCIWSRIGRQIFRQRDVDSRFAEMVERGICGDAAEPGFEVAIRAEAGVSMIGAQESFHG